MTDEQFADLERRVLANETIRTAIQNAREHPEQLVRRRRPPRTDD